jgi:hypothetical protein
MSPAAPQRRRRDPEPRPRRRASERSLEIEEWVYKRTPARHYTRDELAAASRITLGLWLIAGLILIDALWKILQTAAGSGDIPGGVLNTLVDLIALGNVVLAIGLLLRREFARLTYLCMAVVSLLMDLIGAASSGSSIAADVLSLVLLAIPVWFVTRPSVIATFR